MEDPGLEFEGSSRNTKGSSNIDWWYGGGEAAWPSLAIALSNIPFTKRSGLTIGVISDSIVKEYWWPDTAKLTDVDVELKLSKILNNNGSIQQTLREVPTVQQLSDPLYISPSKNNAIRKQDVNETRYEGLFNEWTGMTEAYKVDPTLTPNGGDIIRLNGEISQLITSGSIYLEQFGKAGGAGFDSGPTMNKALANGKFIQAKERATYWVGATVIMGVNNQVFNVNGAQIRSLIDMAVKDEAGNTILDANGNPNSAAYLMQIKGEYARLENAYIFGSSARPTAGIRMTGFRSAVQQVLLQTYFVGRGIYMNGAETQIHGTHNKISGATRANIYIDKVDCEVHNMYSEKATALNAFGIDQRSGSGTFRDVHIFDCSKGFNMNAAGQNILSSVYIDTMHYGGLYVKDCKFNNFHDVWAFRCGQKGPAHGFNIVGASADNQFIGCRETSNASKDPVTKASVPMGWRIPNNQYRNLYIGCRGNLVVPEWGSAVLTNSTVMYGIGKFKDVETMRNKNTGDETTQTIVDKLGLNNIWYTVPADIPLADGRYKVTIPTLSGKSPSEVFLNNVLMEPSTNPAFVETQFGYDTSGNIYFRQPIMAGDRIMIRSVLIPVSVAIDPLAPDNGSDSGLGDPIAIGNFSDNRISNILGTFTEGPVPFVWQTAGAVEGIENTVTGMSAKQAQSNSPVSAFIDIATPNFTYKIRVSELNGSKTTRYLYIIFRYVDEQNFLYLRITNDATNDVWDFGKRVLGVDELIVSTFTKPALNDELRIDASGTNIVFYINDELQGSYTVTEFSNATKLGARFNGWFNRDKFTSVDDMMVYSRSGDIIIPPSNLPYIGEDFTKGGERANLHDTVTNNGQIQKTWTVTPTNAFRVRMQDSNAGINAGLNTRFLTPNVYSYATIDSGLTNFRLTGSVPLRLGGNSTNDSNVNVAFLFRYVDDENYYALRIGNSGLNNYWQIRKRVAGQDTVILEAPIHARNQDRVELIVKDSEMKFTVNGVLSVTPIVDTQFATATIMGFRGRGNVDNASVIGSWSVYQL